MTNQHPLRTVQGEYDQAAQVQGSPLASGDFIYMKVGDENGFASIKLTPANARLLAQVLVLTAIELEGAQ